MNLDDLRAVQADERETDSLQPLRDSFYREVADYVDELRTERQRAAEAADDPFDSDEVRQLTDEIETVEEVVEAIYDRRVGKVVKRASLTASGLRTDEAGLTAEEAELFDGLVSLIEANRRDVLSTIDAGDEPVDRDDQPEPAEANSTGHATDAPTDDQPAADDGNDGDDDRLTVRITQDVGEIFGVDERVYELTAEDVVSLPAENAEPLLERDAAQRIG